MNVNHRVIAYYIWSNGLPVKRNCENEHSSCYQYPACIGLTWILYDNETEMSSFWRNVYQWLCLKFLTNSGFWYRHWLKFRQHDSLSVSEWVHSTMIYGVSIVLSLNSSLPGQNGRHLTDDIFRCIFVNEKFCVLVKISLKFVHKGPVDNHQALVKIMAWRRLGDKPLSELMLIQFTDAYMRH